MKVGKKVQKGITKILLVSEMQVLLVRSPLEQFYLFIYFFVITLYINNDRPQVHCRSEIQFNFLNHILLILLLYILLLLLLLLLCFQRCIVMRLFYFSYKQVKHDFSLLRECAIICGFTA